MKDYKKFFKGKKITVMGLGLLGGVGDIKFLAECGAELIVTDLKEKKDLKPSLDALRQFKNIKYTLGSHDLDDFKNRDLIIKAPSTPLDSPYIAFARKHNIPITMWAALFSKFAQEVGVKVVGITGTRGKTTTTAMIVHILRTAHKKVIEGGNVQGTSVLSNLPKLRKGTIVVLELDSWKLQGFNDLQISPNVSVFTTFLPDHLNYYAGDMKKYFMDKANIFGFQKKGDVLIVGKQVVPFLKKWTQYRDKQYVVPPVLLPKGWTLRVPGEHNIYNASLAREVAQNLGIKDAVIKKALQNFKGVAHRLQLVREIKGVKFYNDTTATTPDATIVALHTLGGKNNNNIVLIAGGTDKNLDMGNLIKEIPRYCKAVVLLSGNGTDRVKVSFKSATEVDNLKKAVTVARKFAQRGDIILLSPAFASLGMFKNEYDRGDQFMKIVKNLK